VDWATRSAKKLNALSMARSDNSAHSGDRQLIKRPDFRSITEAAAMQWLGMPAGDGPPVLIGSYHGPAILERLQSDLRPCSRKPA
jgi:hypothetical protein